MNTKKKIVGPAFSMGLPKPDLLEGNPRKGSYVLNKEEFLKQAGGGPSGPISWHDLTDRPFYEEGTGAVIEWDATSANDERLTFENVTTTDYHCKVSDLTPSIDELVGAVVTVDLPSHGINNQSMALEETMLIKGQTCVNALMLYVAYSAGTCELENGHIVSVPSPGTYGLIMEGYRVKLSYGSTIVKTLDEKFIPDTIARKSDVTWENLPDKPFYADTAVIEWDGNVEGREQVMLDGNPVDFYKVSDATPSTDDFIGASCDMNIAGVQPEFTSELISAVTVVGDGAIMVGSSFLVAYETVFTIMGMECSAASTGVYFNKMDVGGGKYEYPKILSYGSTTIKTLDDKYIPESIARVNPTAAALLIEVLLGVQHGIDQSANIAALAAELGVTVPDQPDVPVVPDQPDQPEIPDGVGYTITRNLSNVIGFDDAATIAEGGELLECFISSDECTINGATATVTMGGADITETAWDNGVVNIPEVTGDVVINIEAVQIPFVVPPMEDFKLRLYGSNMILVEGYTGTAKAIEIPAVFTHEGKEYPLVPGGSPVANSAVLYEFALNANVEHLKSPISGVAGVSGSKSPNIRTLDVPVDTRMAPIRNLTKLEKIPTTSADSPAYTVIDANSYGGCTSIRTARNVVYSKDQTGLRLLFQNCTGLVDGGVIPAQVSDIKFMFFGCKNLRRLRIEGKTFADKTDWAYGVTDLELECHLDSEVYTRLNPPIGWTYKAIDGTPVHRILCFGDSLTANTYESTLIDLCPINAAINSLATGGHNSGQIYQIMTNGTYDKLLKDGVIIIWHGTNGYGSDGFDGVTAKMVAALNDNQRYLLIPPTSQGVGGEVYESWVTTYGADHVLSMGDWFASHGYTVSDYQTDGTHFTADGYALAAQAIHEKIQHWL